MNLGPYGPIFLKYLHRVHDLYLKIITQFYLGKLTPAEKELIVVATSAKNNCQYCVVAHSAVHRIFSKKPYLADQVFLMGL